MRPLLATHQLSPAREEVREQPVEVVDAVLALDRVAALPVSAIRALAKAIRLLLFSYSAKALDLLNHPPLAKASGKLERYINPP
jgi:hypothetical protein